jgi:hypothetical protein
MRIRMAPIEWSSGLLPEALQTLQLHLCACHARGMMPPLAPITYIVKAAGSCTAFGITLIRTCAVTLLAIPRRRSPRLATDCLLVHVAHETSGVLRSLQLPRPGEDVAMSFMSFASS